MKVAILAPLNKDVSKINSDIIERIPGNVKSYQSFDSVKDQVEGALQFTPQFLNSVDIADLPPHELKLKVNTISGVGTGMAGMAAAIPTFTQTMCVYRDFAYKLSIFNSLFSLPYLFKISSGATEYHPYVAA